MDIKDLLPIIEEIKTAAAARANENGAQLLEFADRLLKIEQAGFAPAGSEKRREESAGELLVKSLELKQLRDGQRKSLRVAVQTLSIEQKAILTSAPGLNPAMQTNEIFGDMRSPRVTLRSLIPTRPTTFGSIDYVSMTRAGVAGVQVTEGSTKAQIDLVPTPVNAPVVTIAVWSLASRQALDDNMALRDFVGSTLLDSVQDSEDAEMLLGPGGAGRMSGFMTVASAYDRTTIGDTAIDVLRRACTQVSLQGGTPTGIVIAPEGLETLELRKDASGQYILSLNVDALGRTVLWRVPLITSIALGATDFLIGDFRAGSRLWDRQQAAVEVSTEDSDNFRKNLVTVRAEERLALTVPRPTLFVRGTFS